MMLLKILPGLLCVILLSHTGHALWYNWGQWSDCSVNCGTGSQARTRTCQNELCFGDSTENQPCHKLCGCQLAPCGSGTCIQNANQLDVYDCACPINYSGNYSQDCNTLIGTPSPTMIALGNSTTISSPFYPDFYPVLVHLQWTIQTTTVTYIQLTFDQFNVNAPGSSSCLADYKNTVLPLITTNVIGSLPMTDTEINRVCPCIYDMLVVNKGNSTDILDTSYIYCNAQQPPSSLLLNTDSVTLVLRTDQTSFTGVGRRRRSIGSGNPGFVVTVSVGVCLSSPCQNAGTCIEGSGSYSCVCHSGYNGTNCQVPVGSDTTANPSEQSPGPGQSQSGTTATNSDNNKLILAIVLSLVFVTTAIVIVIAITVAVYMKKQQQKTRKVSSAKNISSETKKQYLQTGQHPTGTQGKKYSTATIYLDK